MLFLCTCGTLARGKFFFLEKQNKNILEMEQSQWVGGTEDVFCNCVPYCFIKTLLI